MRVPSSARGVGVRTPRRWGSVTACSEGALLLPAGGPRPRLGVTRRPRRASPWEAGDSEWRAGGRSRPPENDPCPSGVQGRRPVAWRLFRATGRELPGPGVRVSWRLRNPDHVRIPQSDPEGERPVLSSRAEREGEESAGARGTEKLFSGLPRTEINLVCGERDVLSVTELRVVCANKTIKFQAASRRYAAHLSAPGAGDGAAPVVCWPGCQPHSPLPRPGCTSVPEKATDIEASRIGGK